MQRFLKAAGYLSKRIYSVLRTLPEDFAKSICEIRLRSGKPLALVNFEGSVYLTPTGRLTGIIDSPLFNVTQADIKESFSKICDYSVYTHSKDIASGFITVGSGHRAGICGSAVYDSGAITAVRDVCGINLRIAREFTGCASKLISSVCRSGVSGFLLCGAPSTGKTTMLRDAARIISDEMGKKVSIVDERGEIAAVSRCNCANNVGINTDVLDGYSKYDGILQSVRTLSPDIIICDEIGAHSDIEAVLYGVNSGVCFASSVHASNMNELKKKPGMKELLDAGAYENIVFLDSSAPCRIREIVSGISGGE